MATYRQADLGGDTLKLYIARLKAFELEDVKTACREISEQPRRQGETAFPDLPTIVVRVQQAYARRISASIPRDCPICSHTAHAGWIPHYGEHVSIRTGSVSKVVVAMARCSCRKVTR